MLQTLFHIPDKLDWLGGVPVFGFGALFWLWVVFSVGLICWLTWRQGFNAETRGHIPVLVIVGLAIAFLLPRIVEAQGLPVRGYGVMFLVGVVAGVGLAIRQARRMGLDPEIILGLSFWMFIGGVLGARTFYVVEYWHDFTHNAAGQPNTTGQTISEILNVTGGGLVVYGGLIGGLLAFAGFVRRYSLPALALCDLITPSMALGAALGRIGCFLNGCCYGGLCDWSWAVQFPERSPPYVRQAQTGQLYGLSITGPADAPPVISDVEPGSLAAEQGLKPGDRIAEINGVQVATVSQAHAAMEEVFFTSTRIVFKTEDGASPSWSLVPHPDRTRPVHPTQLYSTVDGAILCLLLLAYYPYRRRDGEVIALGLTLYPITRFLMEMIRTDEPGVLWGLTISQIVSLLLLIGVAGLWAYIVRQPAGSVLPASAT
jgi:phosphatidylglycerol:prolipoprotein diacylglycerol transferase